MQKFNQIIQGAHDEKGLIGGLEIGLSVIVVIGVILAGYIVLVKKSDKFKIIEPSGLPISSKLIPSLNISNPTSSPKAVVGCKRTGCSNQLCIDADAQDVATTCEFLAEYGCYQKAKCERQANGRCGFTETAELRLCLNLVNN